jgi:hypothetical protein
VVGTQGTVTEQFADQVTTATITYLDTSQAETT